MQRDIRIFFKDNTIKDIKDIYQYNIYHKANEIEILSQKDYLYSYSLNDISQIIITTKLENQNWATTNDFIIF